MGAMDNWVENLSRAIAGRTSRRGFLARCFAAFGTAALPLLPVARSAQADGPPEDLESDDPLACAYWRYCAIDGYLCGCCGGSYNACPPGTEMSPITWIGTCKNPADGRNYLISYNDCCGKSTCNRCFCARSEGEKPVYIPAKSAGINWCLGTSTNVYHCSTAIVIGVQ